jgi:hypothetical protein
MPEPDRIWLHESFNAAVEVDGRLLPLGHDGEPVEYVRADWALAWFKDRHLAWCRGEDSHVSIGFEEWIDGQWAAAGREADR